MSGLWNQSGVPRKGWRCVGVEDLRPDDHADYAAATCEMCGQEQLRFVHAMEHDEYAEQLEVGCVCAEKMSEGYDGKAREARLINRAKRKAHWLGRKWRTSRKGNQFLNVDGCNVGIYPAPNYPGKWRWWISDCDGRASSNQRYENADAAKLALFDALANYLKW